MKNACFMFRLLHNVLNFSEIKWSPKSDIIFFGNPNSAKIILYVSIRLSADKSSFFDDRELVVIVYNTKVVYIM